MLVYISRRVSRSINQINWKVIRKRDLEADDSISLVTPNNFIKKIKINFQQMSQYKGKILKTGFLFCNDCTLNCCIDK